MLKREVKLPLLAIVFLALSGALMHARIHHVSFDPANPSNPAFIVPFIAGFLSIIAAPVMMSFKETFVVGYLINGITVIIGTLTMALMSVVSLPSPLTVSGLVFKTMLAPILLLFPKLFLGQMVLFHYYPNGMGRMFTAWWWTRHFVYLGVIFALGHLIWR